MIAKSCYESLFREWQGRILTMARTYHIPGWDLDDVVQELNIVLWVCHNNYNSSKGAQFNTFFYKSAKNKMMNIAGIFKAEKRDVSYLVALSDVVEVLEESAIKDVIFVSEMSSLTENKKVQFGISYVCRGGDIRDLPVPINRQVRKLVKNHYAGRGI